MKVQNKLFVSTENSRGLKVKIKYSKDALKFLSKLDKKSVMRIRDAIEGLSSTPPIGDIKPMQGYNDGRKRLRIGSWRIIYRLEKEETVEIIFVIDIGNRGDIYK
jgi:addiction module toxin, relE/stbE family